MTRFLVFRRVLTIVAVWIVTLRLAAQAQDVLADGALGAGSELVELRLKMSQLLKYQLAGVRIGTNKRQSDFVAAEPELEPAGEGDKHGIEFTHASAAGTEGKGKALQLRGGRSSSRPDAAAADPQGQVSGFQGHHGRSSSPSDDNSTVMGSALMGNTDRLRDSLLSKIRARSNYSGTHLDALVEKLEKSQASWDSGKVSYCWNAALAVHKKCGGKGVVSFNDLSTKAECERKAIEGRKKSYAWVDTTKRCQVFNACTRFKSSGQPWKIFDRCSF